MQLAKIEKGQLITTYADNEDRDIINQMVADGFKISSCGDKYLKEC